MATKTKTAGEAQTPEAGIVSAGAEQAAEQTAPGREANQAEEAREQTPPAPVETPETSADREKEAEAPALEQLSMLADRHRVPSWQQAALLRFMDWTEDRLVSDADYRAALESLHHRRMGGGRR